MDPNPARGMPAQLQRYWLVGKGAAKIRWNVPGDFLRCVRALAKYFPKDPKGLCNILHTKATGGPPGHGSAEHSLTAASQALMSMQPELGPLWAGPLGPINRPTSEPRDARIFEPGALERRSLPLPLAFRKVSTPQGHAGSVTVARILGTHIGPDHKGRDWLWGYGDWLDPAVVPEVTEARYLVDQGVVGPSLDPGGPVVGTMNPETGAVHMSKYTFGGATLVAIPAFTDMRIFNLNESGDWPDDDPDMVMPVDEEGPADCGCDSYTADVDSEFVVNTTGWQGMPLAPREAVFDNDDAVRRIVAWAAQNGGQADPKLMAKMFMWRDPRTAPSDPASYRLPFGDIISGKPTLVYHAVYAAAALLSGAHGGLPNIPDQDKNHLRGVISAIYPEMAKTFGDPNIRAPWDRPANVAAREDAGVPAKEFAMAEKAGYPVYPPKEWFTDPKLSAKTPLTVGADGRVYGHLAAWNECHRDVTMQSCVLAPHSMKDYEPFHLGTVFTAEGDSVRVGKIVMDTRHAGINLGYRAAAIHYDDTGDEVAVVRAGEDEYGVWVAGAVVPEADERKVAKLRRSPISGDWRAVDGNLELTAALAVNVPAFPVYSMDGDERLALVAAGTVIFEEDYEMQPEEFAAAVDNYDAQIDEDEAQEDRAWELRAVIEDHDQFAQWRRAKDLYEFAVAAGQEQLPADPGPDPIYGDMAITTRQADAQFTVMEDTGAGTEDTETGQPDQAPVAPAAPQPVPVA